MLFGIILIYLFIAFIAIVSILKIIVYYKVKNLAVGQIYKPRIGKSQITYIIKELVDCIVIYQLCGTNKLYNMPKENFVIVFKRIN